MSGDRHHNSAICHIATLLLTRIAACRRAGQPYVLRDVDGREITQAQPHHPPRNNQPTPPRDKGNRPAPRNDSKRTNRSHRSRQALQHPGPSPKA